MDKHLFIISLVTLILYSVSTHADISNMQMKEMSAADSVGKPGDVDKVSRTIKLTLLEYMFLPNEIWVEQGETVSFIVNNRGERSHEMLIGTKNDLKNAAKMRRKYPDKDYFEPGLVQLDPGEQKELIWYFDQAGIVEFACPLPGHFKGMRGTIYVEKK